MQEFFLEQPVLLAICGLLMAGVAFFAWMQTNHKAALYSTVGLAAATLILVILSIQIETSREQIEKILSQVAALVEKNDNKGVMAYVHPNAVAGVSRFETELPRYKFTQARITRVKDVTVNTDTVPETAIAEFNVFVIVVVDGQSFRVPRFVKVYFRKNNDRWMVNDFEHFEPTAGFRDTPSGGIPMSEGMKY